MTTNSQHQVEARAQVSGRKLIPWQGKPQSSEHYFTHEKCTLPLIHLDDKVILAGPRKDVFERVNTADGSCSLLTAIFI